MPPQIASCVFALGVTALFFLDRDPGARTSKALWIAVAWIFLCGSRSVSQWLGVAPEMDSPDVYLEGSPLDRAILTGLLVAGVVVLVFRGRRSAEFLGANKWILLFFFYCLVSVVWSDFPLVAFKRWSKFLGNMVIVLVVLTDKDASAAVKRVFARTGFVLIPISLLFVKYYPALGKGFNRYTWTTFYKGASTDKNGLGAICLIWGLVSVWRFLEAYRAKKSSGRTGSLIAHGTILVVTLWLLHLANSSTATACFAVGTTLLVISSGFARSRPRVIHAIVGVIAFVGLLSYVFDDAWAAIVGALGRETSLTGRTDIWNDVLNVHVNPLIGTGFESFWLGARAQYFWNKYAFHPNQAHNGYIEVFLNLGWIGVFLLVLTMLFAYSNAMSALRRNLPAASLMVAFVVMSAIYNITEAVFKVMHPVFIAFLFSAITVPRAPDESKYTREIGINHGDKLVQCTPRVDDYSPPAIL